MFQTMSNEQLFFSWANAVAVEPKSIIASSEIMALIFMIISPSAFPIANCRLPIFVRLIVFKLAINNRQLAIFCWARNRSHLQQLLFLV